METWEIIRRLDLLEDLIKDNEYRIQDLEEELKKLKT